jgi:heme-degrading monooxygenase HmoA
MAIVIRARVAGMTQEIYDRMSVQMLEAIKTKKGFIAHAGCPIPGGWEVVEFWESQDDFDAWIKGTVIPAASAQGMAPSSLEVQQARRVETRR